MREHFPPVLFLLAALPASCGRAQPPGPPPATGAPPPTAEVHAGGGRELLRIAPDMLRDLRITTTRVERRPGADRVKVLGELQVDAERYAEVSPAIPARVVQLLTAVGDEVEAGGPLAILESVELGRARADLAAARAEVEAAQRVLERKRALAAERIVPQRELDEAERAAAAAAARRMAAEAALRALGVAEQDSGAGARFTLRSPVAGTVLARDTVLGQMAAPERPVFRVGDLSRLWLVVHAFERDAVRLRPGALARVWFPALPGQEFAAEVALLGALVDPSSRTLPVRLELANEGGALRPGMSASAEIPLAGGPDAVLCLPAACLQRLADGWSVFVPRGEGAFEIRAVGRGRDLGGEVEILSGAEEGETVVLQGAFLLKSEAEKSAGGGEAHDHD